VDGRIKTYTTLLWSSLEIGMNRTGFIELSQRDGRMAPSLVAQGSWLILIVQPPSFNVVSRLEI